MTPTQTILRSPALRLAGFAMLGLGVMNASVAPYISLVAIERIGVSEGTYALVLVAAAAVAVLSAVLMGVLGDQRGRRHLIAGLTALASFVGLGLMAFAPSPLALVLCHAFLFPLGSALYGQIFALARLAGPQAPGAADGVLGIIRSGMSIAFMAMLIFWTFAFGAGVDVMWVYDSALIAALALLLMVWFLWPRGAGVTWDDRPSGLNLREALRELARPLIASRLFMLGAINASAMLYFVLIGLVFEASPIRDASDVALYVGLVAGWEVPCLILLPRLVAYVSRGTLIAVGAAAYGLHVLLMPIWVDTVWLWAGTLIAGVGGTAFIGLSITYYQDLLQDRPGAASAMLALQKLIADILGASAFAIGMAIGGYQTVAVMGFALTLGGAMALYWADRTGWLTARAAGTVS